MATTIHAHIEVKKDGKWLHYGNPDVNTNYILFACINGLDKEEFKQRYFYHLIHPAAKVNELPDDISEVTKICLEMDKSDHARLRGFGVLDSEDIEKLQQNINEINKSSVKQCDLEEDIFKTYIGGGAIAQHRGFDDVRIVFWFDH